MVETFEIESSGVNLFGRHDSLSSASAFLPAGSYTSLRTYDGERVLRLGQHVRRLEESLSQPAPLDLERVRSGIAGALARTRYRDSRLRLTFAPPRLYVSVEPFEPLPERLYREGARCVTLAIRRDNPHAKDTRFIATAARAYAALPPGVDEGLMLGDDGAILEGLSSNVFVLLDGALHTEDERVLHGVTRALALELAADLVPLVRSAPLRSELASARECFLTSVSREILPVVEIDGTRVADGVPGPTTRELMARFRALVEREAMSLGSFTRPREIPGE